MHCLRPRVGEAVALAEKVGKCPKERLCAKHLSLTSPEVASLCGCAAQVFSLLMQPIDAEQPMPILVDDCWLQPVGRPISPDDGAPAIAFGAALRTQELLAVLRMAVLGPSYLNW